VDAQLARAVSNALWPNLKRNRWSTHTVTRDLSKSNPHAYTTGPRVARVPTTPAASTTIIQHQEQWISCLLLKEEYDGDISYAIHLDRARHDDALSLMTAMTLRDYRDLQQAACRQPFTRQLNRHGIPKLRRNPHEVLVTPLAALALEKIAHAATLRALDEDNIDEFLLGDADLPDDLVASLARQGGCKVNAFVYSRV
jgi:hypothetical protein